MIISRVDRDALYDAYLAIDGLAFPGDIAALCFQLGEALKVMRTPSIADVEASIAELEASVGGLRQAAQRIHEAKASLRGAWSGEAAQTGRAALAGIEDDLLTIAASIRDEIVPSLADLRATTKQAATIVDTTRLRLIRAFSLTPQLRRYVEGEGRSPRYAALFALIKTEARQGLALVMGAYQDFDQASLRFIAYARPPADHRRTSGDTRSAQSGRSGPLGSAAS